MAASPSASAPTGQARQPRNPISRRQIETVASRSVAIFGLVFGAQTFPVTLSQMSFVQPAWGWSFTVAIYGGLLASVVASMIRRFVTAVNTYVALAFLIALLLWPAATVDPNAIAPERPWLWFLCTVATAAATIAFSAWVASAYLIAAPVVYGLVRMTPAGGGKSLASAGLDTAYAIILGGAVLLIITMLRQAAASVDGAQSTALGRYAHAVGQHATEVERVQVDAIVHDSVLTTLLSAARAYTPEAKELAASMAVNAMGYLKDAAATSPDDHTVLTMRQLSHRITGATSTLSAPFELHADAPDTGTIPVQSAEAVYSAAFQAMVNSLQHAGDTEVRRWISISGSEDSIEVQVGDEGNGFDFREIPVERLGLRVSILERIANAGGQASIQSEPGHGTVITIRWPRPQGIPEPIAPEFDESLVS